MTPNNNDTATTAGAAVAPTKRIIPTLKDLFVQQAPSALAPNFIYSSNNEKDKKDKHEKSGQEKSNHDSEDTQQTTQYTIVAQQAVHYTGLTNAQNVQLATKIWGYGEQGEDHTNIKVTWPGKTFEVKSNNQTKVKWINDLRDAKGNPLSPLLPIDNSLHWCYSLKDKKRNIATDGAPLVAHLHGGHSSPQADGNPEYFEGLTANSRGPRFVSNEYQYDNSQRAGALWYHDHALGITRLNVYSGLAGFYIIRDQHDTGKHNNPLGLPAKQYELAYLVQDRMFKENGDLFFPAFPGDPEFSGFIDNPKVQGPSILAEFFGDHIVVNGKLWPKASVEPRHYRIRLLNGSDSRFMRLQLRSVTADANDLNNASQPLGFTVIGSDQGLLEQSTTVTSLDFMPGERLDIVFDFSTVPANSRVIIENILGDAPFTGVTREIGTNTQAGSLTDRIMAFDVNLALNSSAQDYSDSDKEEHDNKHGASDIILDLFNKQTLDSKLNKLYPAIPSQINRYRKLGLFEGSDDLGRLMPMLGTAEPVTDVNSVQVQGAMPWGNAVTENPNLGDTEIWEFYNVTSDVHPIHVHLVHFEIISRDKFTSTNTAQAITQHDGKQGIGAKIENINIVTDPNNPANPVLASEKGPKDMVMCYPGEVTRIKMVFDRPGRYVWHCHILSHEDHEMMRPIHVGPGPF